MRMKSVKTRKGFKWLVVLMTASLIGITGIQAYWISNAYSIKEEKFDQQVGESLAGLSRRLEALESINFLYDSFRIEPFFSAQSSDSQNFIFKDTIGKRKQRDKRFQFSMRVNGDTILQLNSDSSQLALKGNMSAVADPEALLQNMPLHWEAKMKNLDAIFKRLVLHEMRKGMRIENRLNKHDLDSLLYFELLSRGVNVPYEFAVMQDLKLGIKSSGWKPSQEQHKAALFPSDFLGNQWIMVSFPGKANYLLSSMWLTLVMSVLFTIAMIYTFSRTLAYSIRQKRINDIKTDFINNMTHEFKTPIATISLAIDALNNDKVIGDAERVKHYSKVIKQENHRMNMQVESVLRMALMDKKELELNYEEVEVQAVLEECVEHINLALEAKGGHCHKFFNDPHTVITADRNHLANTIINILDNGLKYSVGVPELKVVTELTQSHIIIIISDKGIGMNKEEQKRIFDRFFRVTSGNIHNIKGHGLGLSYAQGIIQAHGGKIDVESEPNRGSKFYIYLPLNAKTA